jgi:uncharacterized protein (DUF885 family)
MTNAASTAVSIATAADAETLVRHLSQIMEVMLATIEEETALVRQGHLRDATALEATKAELARLYLADTALVKANAAALKQHVPELVASLRAQHDTFQALLQINLTVLATAHAVSEGLIRGAAAEAQRKSAPQTYGMSGRPNEPRGNAVQPVTVSRTL